MTQFKYIVADHIRAACFLIADGVLPGPKQQGYILRRLIRRSFSASLKLKIDLNNKGYFDDLVDASIKKYENIYPELDIAKSKMTETLLLESQKYLKALERGKSEWQKELKKLDQSHNHLQKQLALKTWDLYQTHGVPIEASLDILDDNNLVLDQLELDRLIEEHQKLSQTTSAGQFKSGLGEHNETTTKLHTATHLLHQTLRNVINDSVEQRGSAITSQKARFDFTTNEKITPEQLKEIQNRVQKLIDLELDVVKAQMSEKEARELGAIGLFGEKYGETVTVYTVQDKNGKVYSREFCGGPHVSNTKEIGTFKIIKQESLGAGLRRVVFNVE